MINNEKDYFFYINWEDASQNTYRIGILAYIDDNYYLKLNSKENLETAYKRGCIGIPGFQSDRVYKSENLFDFFERRTLEKKPEKIYEDFCNRKGKSMVDSFFLEKVPEKLNETCKEVILNMLKNQEEIARLNNIECRAENE